MPIQRSCITCSKMKNFIVFFLTWYIERIRYLRRLFQTKDTNISINGLDMADVIDVKHTDFTGHITVSGNNEDLNVIYHVKNGKLDLEYLKVKDQTKDK